MGGSRNFKLSAITRHDFMALTEDAEKVSGISYVMKAYRDVAHKILVK